MDIEWINNLVIKKIAYVMDIEPDTIAPSQDLFSDLGFQDMDWTELVMELEDDLQTKGPLFEGGAHTVPAAKTVEQVQANVIHGLEKLKNL